MGVFGRGEASLLLPRSPTERAKNGLVRHLPFSLHPSGQGIPIVSKEMARLGFLACICSASSEIFVRSSIARSSFAFLFAFGMAVADERLTVADGCLTIAQVGISVRFFVNA